MFLACLVRLRHRRCTKCPAVRRRLGRIRFFTRNLLFAVGVELENCSPGSFTSLLTGCRVKVFNKRKFLPEQSCMLVDILLSNTLVIFPVPKTLVAHKLNCTNSFVYSSILRLFSSKLVLENKHFALKVPVAVALRDF